jgi:hypothetical protein
MLVLLYVSLDLSSPFVPGAFNFDPDQCVEGLHRASSPHPRGGAPAQLGRSPVTCLLALPPSPVRTVAAGRHTVLEWLVGSRDDTRAPGDPSPPGEDH